MTNERIEKVASALYIKAYESEFGGKNRGRFLVSREDIKTLIGAKRLHSSTVQRMIDACLELGLVVIDMDDSFAFAEKAYVDKFRKLPTRLVTEFANEIDQEEDDEVADLFGEEDNPEEEED